MSRDEQPMHGFWVVWRFDLVELARARWYQCFVLAFAGIMGLFFAFGLSESSVLGFTGLSRLLLTFMQATILILPIFILLTTARTLVADRELGVWEYLLSWPVDLRAYYWGKVAGRITAIAVPMALIILGAALAGTARGGVPWVAVAWITAFEFAVAVGFVGIAMLISVLTTAQDTALGLAFLLWLALEALIDSLLLGLLVKQRLPPSIIIGMALANPLQAFRTAAIAVFDPDLTVLGPISTTLMDVPGRLGLCLWAVFWPMLLGLVCAWLGSRVFCRKDMTA